MSLRLELLGRAAVTVNGKLEPIPFNKPSSLLFHLAFRATWVSRSELAFLYRSDVSEVDALSYLRKLIFRAKKYPWASGLEINETHLRWLVDSDVKVFREALKKQDWPRALASYQGDLLAGLSLADAPAYAAWLELERSDLERQKRLAERQAIEAHEASGDWDKALTLLESLRGYDLLDEEVLQLQVRILIKSNRQQEALGLYKQFRDLLKKELDAEPLESTEALIDSMKGTGPQRGSKRVSPSEKPRHNLTIETTRFVGRKQELVNLHELLEQANCRLLSIVGLGGTGKTRLALEFGRACLENYADGVFLVPLAGIVSAESIIPTVAGQLGLPLQGMASPEEQLLEYLSDKELLLILDNFEHLLDVAELLEKMLAHAPSLKLMVTSREALELKSEWLFDLDGLTYPGRYDPARETYEAIDLFIKRASRMSKQFVLSEESLKAIAEICRLVEGMPLAIELAATWVRTLGVQDLALELSRNIDLLSLATDKYKSIRSVFDYAWQGLGAQEQTAFAKLAVFQGDFDLEAARGVAGAHLSMLMLLVNRSLIKRTSAGRYTIHELIRQYTLLNQDNPAFRQTHAAYFIALLEALELAIKGENQTEAITVLDQEFENVMQAWQFVARQKDTAALTRGLETLEYYYYFKGYFQLAADDFMHIQEQLPETSYGLRAKFLVRSALFQRNLGRMQAAEMSINEALSLIRQVSDPFEESYILAELAKLHFYLSRYDKAQRYFGEAVDLAKHSANTFIEASSLMGLGHVSHYTQGDVKTSNAYYLQSLRLFRQLGEKDGINAALMNLGAAAYDQQDLLSAQHYYEEAYEIIRTLEQTHREGIILSNLAAIYWQQGDEAKALRYFQTSLDKRWQANDQRGAAETLNHLGRFAYQQENYREACEKHLKALGIFEDLGDLSGVAASKSHYARSLLACGQEAQARRVALEALELAHKITNKTDILSSLLSVAMISKDDTQKAQLAQLVYQEAEGGHEPIRQEAAAFLKSQKLGLKTDTKLNLDDLIKQVLA
ncbi:MAG: tetratricopeptide repeat protein [Trueperaceae bacterium]|nr:tetratricopeptide repeat protein [Trueperaceae bacterium]